MYFCSETGLPVVEQRGDMAGRSTGTGLFPDLLEEQQAQLQLTCDCGVSSSHQAACSLHITGQRKVPPARAELVPCPSCGDNVPLLRPLVIHDEKRHQLILRLPESFRLRANTVMSWWFEWLQRSSRMIIPEYARLPKLEFFAEQKKQQGRGHSTRPSGSMDSMNSIQADMHSALDSFAPSGPHFSSSSSRLEAHASNLSLPSAQSSASQNAMFAPQRTPAPPSSASHSSLSASRPSQPNLSASRPSQPSLSELVPPPRPPSQTLDFGALGTAERNNLSFGEFPLDELSGEFDEMDEPDDGMPTLMVAVPEAKKPKKPASRRGIGNSTVSLSSSPSSVVMMGEELGMLHTEKEDEGTLISPDAIAQANQNAPVRVELGHLAAPLDPSATREAPAPELDVLDELDVLEPIEELVEDVVSLDSIEVNTAKEAPLPKLPEAQTVARKMPESLSDIRESTSRAATAVRTVAGAGISLSPEYASNRDLAPNVFQSWKDSEKSSYFQMELEHQRCSIFFMTSPQSIRVLDEGGQATFHVQLHRLSSYPLVVLLLAIRDEHGELVDTLSCPIDADEHNGLMFLDMLMQNFNVYVNLCERDYSIFRDVQIQLSLEKNVEYVFEQARSWKSSISTSSQSFEQAWDEYNTPEYDRLGKMEHNFNQDSFSDIESPARAQLASGIVAYWSEAEQFDYLITMKSFPIEHFRSIQRRTIEGCMSFGIYIPEHLRQLALDFDLAPTQQDLLRRLLSSFAETNLAIRQPNDLDPWDNLSNWQKLLDACDEYHVEVDEDIEELAELAQRRCQSDGENTHNVDDDDIMEIDGFSDMDPRELVDMLQDPVHSFDAAMALCDTEDAQFVDDVAGVFTHLEREEAIELAEAFTQFGGEAEPLLISWLHLPRPSHREAAMLALGTMSSVQAVDEIIKRLRSGEEWETAAEALGRIGEPALSSLAQEITNKNWLIRLRAVKALQKIHSDRTRPLFEQLRTDPNEVVKAEVAAILNG